MCRCLPCYRYPGPGALLFTLLWSWLILPWLQFSYFLKLYILLFTPLKKNPSLWGANRERSICNVCISRMVEWMAMSFPHWALGVPDLVVSDVITMVIKMNFFKDEVNYLSCFLHCLKAKSSLLAPHENLCLLHASDDICSHPVHLSAPSIVLMVLSTDGLTHTYPQPFPSATALWGWSGDIVLVSMTSGETTGVKLFSFLIKKNRAGEHFVLCTSILFPTWNLEKQPLSWVRQHGWGTIHPTGW